MKDSRMTQRIFRLLVGVLLLVMSIADMYLNYTGLAVTQIMANILDGLTIFPSGRQQPIR